MAQKCINSSPAYDLGQQMGLISVLTMLAPSDQPNMEAYRGGGGHGNSSFRQDITLKCLENSINTTITQAENKDL